MARRPNPAAGLFDGARLLVVFDGWCGVCTRAVEWVRAHDPAGRVRALPGQTPGLKEQLGLSRAQAARTVWAFTRDGRRYAGAAAFAAVLRELGGAWALLARLYAVPPLRWAADRGYAWFARHRGRFARWGTLPACARPGARCEPEGSPVVRSQ
jgi:predicted DCC family thiol-disulfide oxidoreductase YuxK